MAEEHFQIANPMKNGAAVDLGFKTGELPLGAPFGTSKKSRPAQEPAHALLSLGQDLSPEGGETLPIEAAAAVAVADVDNNGLYNINDKTSTIQAHASTKKRKLHSTETNPNSPPDFWHYLDLGEAVGDLDVLCGRGGESNNHIGNKRYRMVVEEKKEEYRNIDGKQRKLKTIFVRNIVAEINKIGGRFLDVDNQGRYYVVTIEKARKKTSQALRETKELKWLDTNETRDKKTNNNDNNSSNKNIICPFCKKLGHKTKIAKSCLFHNEWLDANKAAILNPSFPTIESESMKVNESHFDTEISSTVISKDNPSSLEPYIHSENITAANRKQNTEGIQPIAEEQALNTTGHHVSV